MSSKFNHLTTLKKSEIIMLYKQRVSNIEIAKRTNLSDKLNVLLVRVYSYFASENAGLSQAQLRQRTALCSGVSNEDVERALEVHHQAQYAKAPARKRRRIRRRKSNTPSPEHQEQSHPMEELHEEMVFVKNENDTSNEENPLAYNEDTKPDVADIPVQEPSSSPDQQQCETEDLKTLYLKTEPRGKLRTYPSHRSAHEKSKRNS
ncbi:uncharacterized protein LOC111351476 isoform X2 [Spodoptera litura]|uniref:Uncharacterized protein LOC111351476 isoform X2 n=1 Tax=Spodoptera litura TaxID=69820 RepID=A0A9J7DV95_SPOLT|nr:uncharacterized protein LOC111351476 isoform X2 [Spodoptera litura]